MKFTAKEIASMLNGELEGDADATIDKISRIEEGVPGSLSFLANPKYTQFIYSTKASAVIVNKDFVPEQAINTTLIRVEDAYSSFAQVLEAYDKVKHQRTGISEQAYIADTASIGQDVYIGPFVFIGENVIIGDNVKIYPNTYIADHVRIGDNTLIYAGVKIHDSNVIGKNCTFHSGVVIGSDGFGFAPQEDKHYKKVAQIGNVIIEDDVEIGSNTTIDRATVGSTIIRRGVKLDNLIMIAHNVEIGEHTVIAAQAGISGSTKVGKNCIIAGQAGLIGHLKIGDNVIIGAQSGISTNIKDGSVLLGSPAFDIARYRKAYIHFRNLTKIVERIDNLEKNSGQ
ncbi:MAG: UDP-3-O-(3-hydroxymyristoyl)glucosamine N-acyltransferase [Bacteroidota bacterium]|nr:UDP-3-O-(3-hydroxymyristoyl)glucosamine N-acyltransferase [Bacteroidota bacterium]